VIPDDEEDIGGYVTVEAKPLQARAAISAPATSCP